MKAVGKQEFAARAEQPIECPPAGHEALSGAVRTADKAVTDQEVRRFL